MSALLVGYARCSTDQQDLTAQRDALFGLGVEPDRIYVDQAPGFASFEARNDVGDGTSKANTAILRRAFVDLVAKRCRGHRR